MNTADVIIIVFAILVIASIAVVLNPGLFFGEINTSPGNSENKAGNAGEVKGNAPELKGISGYINTGEKQIKLADYLGKKIILVDFWTYTCINCIRTQPYLKQWDEKYRDDGLLIIGVHTPEFEFEKDYGNVKKAVDEAGLKYPVVQDNDYATWNAYKNHYWPAKYLIDKNGNIVYTHFGEGNYAETEEKIRTLLADLKASPVEDEMSKPKAEEVDFNKIGTPEVYFGYNFKRAPLGNEPGFLVPGTEHDYSFSPPLQPNLPYLGGKWKDNSDNSELSSQQGNVTLIYSAKNVNIVAGSDATSGSTKAIIYVDGKKHKELVITNQALYRVVDGDSYGQHTVEIVLQGKGFRIYTFTFG